MWAEYLKLEHTLFALPMIYAGALLATPPLTLRTGVLILIAATGARTAALGLNRILDRHLDARNPRTRNRALPRGELTLRSARVAVVLAYAVSVAAAMAIAPRLALYSPIPLIAFTAYPLLKRATRWAHLGLGATLALGPLCGWYAVNLSFAGAGPVLTLALFTALWSAGFDVLYATQDEASDRRTGVHSLPAAVGSANALRIAAGFHAAAFAALCALLFSTTTGLWTALCFAAAGVLFVVQHQVRKHLNFAFFHVNAALGAVVFLGVALRNLS